MNKTWSRRTTRVQWEKNVVRHPTFANEIWLGQKKSCIRTIALLVLCEQPMRFEYSPVWQFKRSSSSRRFKQTKQRFKTEKRLLFPGVSLDNHLPHASNKRTEICCCCFFYTSQAARMLHGFALKAALVCFGCHLQPFPTDVKYWRCKPWISNLSRQEANRQLSNHPQGVASVKGTFLCQVRRSTQPPSPHLLREEPCARPRRSRSEQEVSADRGRTQNTVW